MSTDDRACVVAEALVISSPDGMRPTMSRSDLESTPVLHGQSGWVAPGFEEVRVEFERNFAERDEIGAAVAAYLRGDKVVDLWGGRRTPSGDEPWDEDTMVLVNSTTKGLAAMTIAVANSRGWIDYDAPVAQYWSEFAQNGKAAITVRQLLSHEAGLVWIDEPLRFEDLRNLDYVARALAKQSRRGSRGADTATTR
jgi:CubicO group peptidase (beta-lactamase class C family)